MIIRLLQSSRGLDAWVMTIQIAEAPVKQFAMRKTIDWIAAKTAYVERTPCPSYTDLAKEFGCTVAAVSTVARDEDWPAFRKTRQEKTMLECSANDAIIAAVKGEGPILQQARSVTAQFISAIELCVQKLMADAESMKPSSMANILNTIGFAMSNGGKFMDTIGLIGMQKELSKARREGSEGSVPWDKGMMQQINVTVTGMAAEAKAAMEAETKTVPIEDVKNNPGESEAWE